VPKPTELDPNLRDLPEERNYEVEYRLREEKNDEEG
jgi:hypothetical protein